MSRQTLYLWKQAPFLRLVVPLMVGILLQYYLHVQVGIAAATLVAGIIGLIVFNLSLSFYQYQFSWLNGLFINLACVAMGVLITHYSDVSNRQQWMNRYYQSGDLVIATLEEPLTEKSNSFKANASVQLLLQKDSLHAVKGNIIIYFKKDSTVKKLGYGSQVLFRQPLQLIKNAGNPGSFDYVRYAAFQGIYQQVILQPQAYVVLPEKRENQLQHFLFALREKVLKVITASIPGEKEAGLAEALLVGYKDDLDKTLVQSYSNTGVVHIIAISGMHLGLIYWLLTMLLSSLKKSKQTRWLVPVLVIAGLWLFSLLAGGGPSILRSAVMFTCIVIAENVQRKTFIYNSLATSACILLCINPFWLWDAGFQLSYAAVLSIVIFMKPIYHGFHFENKLVDNVWQLMAVTLAAQVLTTPISIYHFHQFPVYFVFTNLLAVPLSSLIVLLEILLCAVGGLPAIAKLTGHVLQILIHFMNGFIEYMEHLPFSLWNGMQINIVQAILLYGLAAGAAFWIMKKNKRAFVIALACMLAFCALRTYSFIVADSRQQFIVYNLPRHQAMDFISGRKYVFKGDSDLAANASLQNLSLGSSRIGYRATPAATFGHFLDAGAIIVFNNKKIALIDKSWHGASPAVKINTDLIVISGSPTILITELLQTFNCRQLVFDGSNAPWKVNNWKQEAAKLGLSCFYTVDNGAFVMNTD